MENKLEKKFGLITAICMVVGIVVGSGVFFKAQNVLSITEGNMPLGILAWVIGGAVMLICALNFSTLATHFEKVNGIVDYGEATVGEGYAYFIAWFSTMIYYPGMTSVLAWVSARYTVALFGHLHGDRLFLSLRLLCGQRPFAQAGGEIPGQHYIYQNDSIDPYRRCRYGFRVVR